MQSYKRNAWDQSLETQGGWGVRVLESRSTWVMEGFDSNLDSATDKMHYLSK